MRFLCERELAELGIGSVGSNVIVHEAAILVGAENIHLGSNVRIDPFCILSGRIRIGNYVHIAAQSCIFGEVTMGDFSGISHGVKLYAKSDDYSGASLTNPTVPDHPIIEAPIAIGRHVIIGSGSVVLPGVTIGEGSAVGALSLVRSSLGEWGIYTGVPARRARDRKRDILDLERHLIGCSGNVVDPLTGDR